MPELEAPKKQSYTGFLNQIEYGALDARLSELHHQMIEAVITTGKKGRLTLQIDYKPESSGQVSINNITKENIPKADNPTTIFFVTPDGNLTQENLRQNKLPLQHVQEEERQALRSVDEAPRQPVRAVKGNAS